MKGHIHPKSRTPLNALAQSAIEHSSNRVLVPNEHLIHAGDYLRYAYIVVTGTLKSYITYRNGGCQITGFHISGDIIGHESLLNVPSARSVVALDTSCVTRLGSPATQLTNTASRTLTEDMYAEIQRLTHQLHLERESRTSTRLASFLLDYSQSLAERGYNQYDFFLPMRRRDLASYLGLATETLSRLFTRLRDQAIIRISNSHVVILDLKRLEAASARTEL